MQRSTLPPPGSDDAVEIVEKITPYRGFFQMDVYSLRHLLYSGGWSQVISREVFERGHAASVLLYDPWRNSVVLVEQFRAGAYAAGMQPWLIEVVAGIIEPDEDAEAVVRREAVEEAGCAIMAIERIGRFIMTPGGSSETLAMYCGCIDSRGAGGLYGLAQEGEDIKALVVQAEEALAMIADGRITAAPAVISLQWLALNRERLRPSWQALVGA